MLGHAGTLGYTLLVVDALQPFDAHVGDLQQDAAGRSGHVDARLPLEAHIFSGVIGKRSWAHIGAVAVSLDGRLRRGAVLDAGTAQIHERLAYPQPIAFQAIWAPIETVAIWAYAIAACSAGPVVVTSIEVARLPVVIVLAWLNFERPPGDGLSPFQNGADHRPAE